MSTASDAMCDALDRLSNRGYEFAGHFSNHGPMVADALVALNAPETVALWCDAYSRRLGDPPTSTRPIDDRGDAWRLALGDFTRVVDWSDYFARRLTEADWESVLRTWWPRLLPGVAAAGTHGMIRTAHAVRALDRCESVAPEPILVAELARGLGYWASRYQTVPGNPTLAGPQDALSALRLVPHAPDDATPLGRGMMGHLLLTGGTSGFLAALDSYGNREDINSALSRLTAAGANILLERMDLPVVFAHLVTAPSAIRFVLPHLSAELHHQTLVEIWKVMAGITASFGQPRLPRVSTVDADWSDDLIDSAVEHGDEHVVKLADAGLREYSLNPDPVYAQAAFHAARHLKPLRRERLVGRKA
ncbi:hypothetical protein [Kribbella sp. NPDC004536]|uniref:hypothetical protein n=1 Tax=Kribbella sp. NPDC004536 TaxID=3364106 RepID=UPI003685E28E